MRWCKHRCDRCIHAAHVRFIRTRVNSAFPSDIIMTRPSTPAALDQAAHTHTHTHTHKGRKPHVCGVEWSEGVSQSIQAGSTAPHTDRPLRTKGSANNQTNSHTAALLCPPVRCPPSLPPAPLTARQATTSTPNDLISSTFSKNPGRCFSEQVGVKAPVEPLQCTHPHPHPSMTGQDNVTHTQCWLQCILPGTAKRTLLFPRKMSSIMTCTHNTHAPERSARWLKQGYNQYTSPTITHDDERLLSAFIDHLPVTSLTSASSGSVLTRADGMGLPLLSFIRSRLRRWCWCL